MCEIISASTWYCNHFIGPLHPKEPIIKPHKGLQRTVVQIKQNFSMRTFFSTHFEPPNAPLFLRALFKNNVCALKINTAHAVLIAVRKMLWIKKTLTFSERRSSFKAMFLYLFSKRSLSLVPFVDVFFLHRSAMSVFWVFFYCSTNSRDPFEIEEWF